MRWIKNIFAFLSLIDVIKELFLYLEYVQIIKKEKLTSSNWIKHKLRYDWFGRIYTVINLPPEVTMSRDFPKEARPAFVFEEIRPINEYLTTLNLHEIVSPILKPISETNSDSFLVIYYYLFRNFSWLWMIRFSVEIFLLTYIYSNYWPIILQTINTWI
jgi:hypothetical protein